MTIQGSVENINSSQYQGEVIWNSTEDLDGIEVTNLKPESGSQMAGWKVPKIQQFSI